MLWRPGFRTKATAGFGAMLVATAVVTAVAVIEAEHAADRATRAAHAEADGLLLTQRLRYRLERIVADGQSYLLFGDRQLLSRRDESWRLVQSTLEELDARITSPGGRAELSKVTQTAGAYRAIVDRAVAERDTNGDIDALRHFEEGLRAHREQLDASMNQLWNDEMRSLDDGLRAVGRSATRAQLFILGTAVIALLFSILLARTVIRELARLYEGEEAAARRAKEALAARDELLAIIAHDLRSPLSAILMKAALLRKKAEPIASSPELRKRVESIEATARRMESLIKSLLDAATIEAGHLSMTPERCDAGDLLHATHDMLEPLATEKAIHVEVREPTVPSAVWADRERVLQVLSNLVTNAIKFVPEGGAIVVEAAPAQAEIQFSVSDTGPGIPAEQRAHVFERFWKADKGGSRGAGLGLYIARGIVAASGGRMWFESRINEGTTFFFRMPSADHGAPDPDVAPDKLNARIARTTRAMTV
jgi:signal transduction histidine kinase